MIDVIIIQRDEWKKEKFSAETPTSGHVQFNVWNQYKNYCLHADIFQFYVTEMKKSIGINIDTT